MYIRSARLAGRQPKSLVAAMLMCSCLASMAHSSGAGKLSLAEIVPKFGGHVKVKKSNNITALETVRQHSHKSKITLRKVNSSSEPELESEPELVSRVGSVYFDENLNNIRDENEIGIAGVKLAAFSGEVVVTDENGYFEIVGLNRNSADFQRSFIVKLDQTSLPKCAKVISDNPAIFLAKDYNDQTVVRSDFAIRPAGVPASTNGEESVVIGHINFEGKEYDINSAESSEIVAKVMPYLKEQDYSVKIRVSELSQHLVVKVDDQVYPAFTPSQIKAKMLGDRLMKQLQIPADQIEYADSSAFKDFDKMVAKDDDGTLHRLRIEVVKTPNTAKFSNVSNDASAQNNCYDPEDAGHIKSLLLDAVKRKPVETVLSDSFFKSDSPEVRSGNQVEKLKTILGDRGGKVVLNSRDKILEKLRVEKLREILAKEVEIVTR